MHIPADKLFDTNGQIAHQWSQLVSGKRVEKVPAAAQIKLSQQTTYVKQAITIEENLAAGLYITFTHDSENLIAENVTNIQITPVYQDATVDWSVNDARAFHWSQIYLTWELIAQITGESSQNAKHFFQQRVATETGGSITLAVTTDLIQDLKAVLEHQGRNLAFTGKLYSILFQTIEHIQVSNHLANCENCQKKLFSSQNLLETNFKLTTKSLAKSVGLTCTAIELGFPIITGMTLTEYQIETAVRKAMAKQTSCTTVDLAKLITAETGLAQADVEKACVKRFGVMSHQLGSMQ